MRQPEIIEHLRSGGLALLMTDTLPGIHAMADRADACARLAEAKGAPKERPFLLLFSSVEAVLAHGRVADPADAVRLRRAWPGPLTALLAPRPGTPAHWVHEGRTLAARVPAAPALRDFITVLGTPLFSTSANLAGRPPAPDLVTACSWFPELPAFDLGLEPTGVASTVVDLSVAPGVVQRAGSAPWPPS